MKDDFRRLSYIIISKEGLNSTNKNRRSNLSQLTFKEGEHSVKINLNTSIDNKINKNNILQTISDYRNKIVIMQQNKNNKLNHYKTLGKQNNRKRIINKLIDEKNLSNFISEDVLNKLDKDNLSNYIKNNKTSENVNNNFNKNSNNEEEEKINPDDTQILVKNNNSLLIDQKNEDDQNENEENLVSSLNKKSVKTQQVKKEMQKSRQISDRAEISKVNSESDNFTDFDQRLKSSLKIKRINDNTSHNNGLIGSNINEKEEFENEIIDANNKDIITILDNNENKKSEIKSQRNIDINESINVINETNNNNIVQKNNFFNKNDQNSKIEHNDNNNLIESSNNKKEIKNNEKENKKENIEKYNNNNKQYLDENINENKKLIPIIPILKKNTTKNFKELPTKEQDLNENQKKKQVSISLFEANKNPQSSIATVDNNFLLNQNYRQNNSINNLNINSINSNNSSNRFLFKNFQNIQKECYLCEKPFYFIKLHYAECGIHFLCRKCLKSYYEDYIEHKNFSKILKCPCAKCDKLMNYEKVVKDIISETHQKIYENHVEENNIWTTKRSKINNKDTNLKLYTEKHVLDVNNNKNIYMFKKSRDRYCPSCLKPYLFSKTNNNFIKCLYCNLKICKYCLKEYTPKHLNIDDEDHCKIRFRRSIDEPEQKNFFIKVLIQIFFVVATFVLIVPGIFMSFLNKFNTCFNVNKKEKNIKFYFKAFISFIFCFIFSLICCPFIILIYSMFPAFIAMFDY